MEFAYFLTLIIGSCVEWSIEYHQTMGDRKEGEGKDEGMAVIDI